MSPQELQTVTEDITQMIAATEAGKMVWTKTSPTTFVWRKLVASNPIAQLSVQRIIQRRPIVSPALSPRPIIQTVENYVFQAMEFPNGSLRLIINTEQDPDARPLLKSLFNTISATIDREGLNFLKQVIGS
jgi:hypothetical protein